MFPKIERTLLLMLTAAADITTDAQSQVSWQSALWALVPIALNSMTQPSGKVLGMPSKFSFYLNSSPIVVTVDALELLFKLVWRTYSTRSLATAAHSITQERFSDVGGSRSGLAQLQEIKSVRLIVFVFGALPQIIKLYAMTGVLRTQICASLFFGSFLIIEAITMWSSMYRTTMTGLDSQVTDLDDSIRLLRRATLSLSYAFPLCLALIVPWFKRCEFVMVWTLQILTITIIGDKSKSHERFREEGLYRVEWSASFNWGLLISVLLLLLILVVQWALSGFDAFFLFLGMIFWLGTILFFTIQRDLGLHPKQGLIKLMRFGHLGFISLHIITALTTYSLMYNPDGTYKPNWTNQLG